MTALTVQAALALSGVLDSWTSTSGAGVRSLFADGLGHGRLVGSRIVGDVLARSPRLQLVTNESRCKDTASRLVESNSIGRVIYGFNSPITLRVGGAGDAILGPIVRCPRTCPRCASLHDRPTPGTGFMGFSVSTPVRPLPIPTCPKRSSATQIVSLKFAEALGKP